jgi:glycosyltransferase involved in cell wall biosynthesis
MMQPQKILYIGSLEKESNSRKRFITLQQMGYKVEGIDVDPFIFGTIWMRFHFHLYIGPGIIALNKTILKKVESIKPDLIWVDNKPYVKPNTLKEIRRNNPTIKIANIITDDPFGKFHYAWRFIYKSFKYYDIHFVQREINIPELKRQGAKRVETCFRSFDPAFHRILPKDDSSLLPYKASVGFIGSYEDDREEYIAYLVQQGISVSITGDGWSKGKYWSLLQPYYKGPSVYGDEYIKTINGMDVALHFLRKANRDQQDSRTFEIPACGTFMLAERSNLHLGFFSEGIEADYFTSKEELLYKLRYYLKETSVREKIAGAGYAKSYASGYDHKSRLTEVIHKIYQPPVSTPSFKKIVIGIYYDPDFYPPTINAINNLSTICEELVVVTRNQSLHDYPYPGNVNMIKIEPLMSVLESEQKSLRTKIAAFLTFTSGLKKQINRNDTDLVVLYDSIPLFSFFIANRFISSKKKIWYHNHDMPATHPIRKYSVSWFSAKYEHKAMNSVDYFSLPSDDRLVFYPNWKNKDNYLCIPNYPSLKLYDKQLEKNKIQEEIKIIFQGTIGEGHGLELLIDLLKERISGKTLRLILKGGVRPQYKESLEDHAKTNGVEEKIDWFPLGPYCELPAITSDCHIGIAIYLKTDNVRNTMGTASNKIYEYAASGLPVIVFDNEQFRKHLENKPWVFFYDGSSESMKKCISSILENHESLSLSALNGFKSELNFEKAFVPVMNKITSEFS